MAQAPHSDEVLQEAAALRLSGLTVVECAKAAGCAKSTMGERLKHAAQRGLLLKQPAAMDGYRISQVSTAPDGSQHVQQKPEHGEQFTMPPGHIVKGVSALVDPDGNEVVKWIKTSQDAEQRDAAMRAVVAGFKDEIPRAPAVTPVPTHCNSDLLCQYTITDVHMGMLAWHEETGNEDYDLSIAEKLLDNWFATAIEFTPKAQTAVLAQLGDLLHHDSHESVTPAHRNVLDADSRFQKMVRAAIRVLRKIVARLLAKHELVHLVFADANHDPASEAWLREMFAAFFEDEPRVTVDSSAGTYYVYKHGDVSLFYHHGHRRGVNNVDSVFAGRYREIYGSTKFSYAHLGHKHSDELKTTNLMKIEQHETLAAPDAYAANGGWLSGRSAKVITYHKRVGEVFRSTVSAQMVAEFTAA